VPKRRCTLWRVGLAGCFTDRPADAVPAVAVPACGGCWAAAGPAAAGTATVAQFPIYFGTRFLLFLRSSQGLQAASVLGVWPEHPIAALP